VRDVCREYEIAETLYYQWRDRLLEGGKAALATPRDTSGDARDQELRDAKKRIANLERALGRKTYEVEVAGELLRDWT
jgi:transposase-like protein